MNQGQLIELYRSHESVQNLFAVLRARRPDDGRTTVEQLSELGGISRSDAIALLKELEALGYGKFTVGRRGHPSRLEWTVDTVELARSLAQPGLPNLSEPRAAAESGAAAKPALDESDSEDTAPELRRARKAPSFTLTPPTAAPKTLRPSEAADAKMVEHAYVLRPNLRLCLELPVDLTQREAEILAEWVRNLSFER